MFVSLYIWFSFILCENETTEAERLWEPALTCMIVCLFPSVMSVCLVAARQKRNVICNHNLFQNRTSNQHSTMKRRWTKQTVTSDSPISFLLHTHDGLIPFMTPTLVEKYFPAPQKHLVLGIAVRDTCVVPLYPGNGTKDLSLTKKKKNRKKVQDKNKPCGFGFSSEKRVQSFLRAYHRVTVPSFDVVQDAISAKQTKQQLIATDNHVMLWTPHGRHALTNADYLKTNEGLESGSFVSLYDVAQDGENQKRRLAARRRTTHWLQETIKGEGNQVWAPLVLTGFPPSPSDKGAADNLGEVVAKSDRVRGFAISGYAQLKDEQVRNKRVNERLQELGCSQKELLVLSTSSTRQLIDCIREGVDIVGSNLPFEWAKAQKAFCVGPTGWQQGGSRKKPHLSEPTTKTPRLDSDGCLDMSDSCWESDTSPLLDGCSSLACQHHTRAYIHHLVKAKELLAQIVLMAHNLHQVLQLCEEATKAKQEGKLDEFCQFIEEQLAAP